MSYYINYKLLGKRIRKAREKKGMSQEDLGGEFDISGAYISRIELGKTRINLERLAQVCTVLDTDIGYILTGTVYESKNYQRDEIMRLLEGCKPDTIQLIKKIIEPVIEEQQGNMQE